MAKKLIAEHMAVKQVDLSTRKVICVGVYIYSTCPHHLSCKFVYLNNYDEFVSVLYLFWCVLYLDNNSLSTKVMNSDYFLWMVNRFSKKSDT